MSSKRGWAYQIFTFQKLPQLYHGIVANMLDCNIISSEFKPHIDFQTNTLAEGMRPLISSAMS